MLTFLTQPIIIRWFHETVQLKEVKSWASTLPNSKDANQCLVSTDLNSMKETWPCAFLLILTVAKNLCKCKTESVQGFRIHPIHHTEVFSLKLLHYCIVQKYQLWDAQDHHKKYNRGSSSASSLQHYVSQTKGWINFHQDWDSNCRKASLKLKSLKNT